MFQFKLHIQIVLHSSTGLRFECSRALGNWSWKFDNLSSHSLVDSFESSASVAFWCVGTGTGVNTILSRRPSIIHETLFSCTKRSNCSRPVVACKTRSIFLSLAFLKVVLRSRLLHIDSKDIVRTLVKESRCCISFRVPVVSRSWLYPEVVGSWTNSVLFWEYSSWFWISESVLTCSEELMLLFLITWLKRSSCRVCCWTTEWCHDSFFILMFSKLCLSFVLSKVVMKLNHVAYILTVFDLFPSLVWHKCD